jgi:hypothetical protein
MADTLKLGLDQPVTVSPSSDSGSEKGKSTTVSPHVVEGLRGRGNDDGAAFEMTEDVRYYKPIDSYEGIHRWDPDFEWEESEEKKIIRKVKQIETRSSELLTLI